MEEILNGISVPAIAAVVYWIVNLIKYATKQNETFLRFIPLVAAGLGIACSLVCFYAVPNIIPTTNVVVAIVIGAASGLSATGFNQIIKQLGKSTDEKVNK